MPGNVPRVDVDADSPPDVSSRYVDVERK